jgi:hypothetical protein
MSTESLVFKCFLLHCITARQATETKNGLLRMLTTSVISVSFYGIISQSTSIGLIKHGRFQVPRSAVMTSSIQGQFFNFLWDGCEKKQDEEANRAGVCRTTLILYI